MPALFSLLKSSCFLETHPIVSPHSLLCCCHLLTISAHSPISPSFSPWHLAFSSTVSIHMEEPQTQLSLTQWLSLKPTHGPLPYQPELCQHPNCLFSFTIISVIQFINTFFFLVFQIFVSILKAHYCIILNFYIELWRSSAFLSISQFCLTSSSAKFISIIFFQNTLWKYYKLFAVFPLHLFDERNIQLNHVYQTC